MSDQSHNPSDPVTDPRLDAGMGAASLGAEADLRPAVAGRATARGPWLIAGAAILLGLVVFLWLGAHRSAGKPGLPEAPSARAEAGAPPTPSDIATFEAASRAGAVQASPSMTSVAQPVAITPSAVVSPEAGLAEAANQARLKAPAMVVDLADMPPSNAAGGGSAGEHGGPAGAATGPPTRPALNGDEQFAQRVGAEEPERAQATTLRNLSDTVPQGAMIPGVLETALDSDLPGYARAVVSREVRGFDGSTVLIPRGSRVIGQYKSAVAQGQSRAFVIWTRILRPDGVSIQIGSSGTDPLGRAGLSGSVNRHFFETFGGAILLSVIDAGISTLGNQPSTQIVIGSSQQAVGLAGAALLPTVIPPTIKVPQGTPIRIFVARDLDFSTASALAR